MRTESAGSGVSDWGIEVLCVRGHVRHPEAVVAAGDDPAGPESQAAEASSVEWR